MFIQVKIIVIGGLTDPMIGKHTIMDVIHRITVRTGVPVLPVFLINVPVVNAFKFIITTPI